MFLLVTIPTAFLLHLWVCYSLTRPAPMRAHAKKIWLGLSLLFALMLIAPLSWRIERDFLEPETAWAALWAAYLAMGFYSFLFVFFVLKTTLWQLLRIASWRAPVLPKDRSRRDLVASALNLSVFGAAGGAAAVGYQEAMRRARVLEVKVPVQGLPKALEGFKIVQLSDIHVGPSIKRDYLQAIVDKVNTLDADLIALTGDLVDAPVHEIKREVTPFSQLKARQGVFACLGNHEYYAGAPAWVEHFERLGVTVLLNSAQVIERGGAKLLVGGTTDFSAGRRVRGHRFAPQRCLDGAPAVDLKVLLAHQPRSIYAASKVGFDLMLSGHTHGGQFFPWSWVVHLAQPYVAGLQKHDKTWIYVSRGTGYFGPPYRMLAPSEITLLRLESA